MFFSLFWGGFPVRRHTHFNFGTLEKKPLTKGSPNALGNGSPFFGRQVPPNPSQVSRQWFYGLLGMPQTKVLLIGEPTPAVGGVFRNVDPVSARLPLYSLQLTHREPL